MFFTKLASFLLSYKTPSYQILSSKIQAIYTILNRVYVNKKAIIMSKLQNLQFMIFNFIYINLIFIIIIFIYLIFIKAILSTLYLYYFLFY